MQQWQVDRPHGGAVVHAPPKKVDPESREAGPVEGRSAGVGVRGDAGLAPDPGLSSSPWAAHEVGDLALHFGPGAGVSLLPVGIALLGLVSLEEILTGVDRDGAPGGRGGARRPQRAAGAPANDELPLDLHGRDEAHHSRSTGPRHAVVFSTRLE